MPREAMVRELSSLALHAFDSYPEPFTSAELASACFTLTGHVVASIIQHSAPQDREENVMLLKAGLMEVGLQLSPLTGKGN